MSTRQEQIAEINELTRRIEALQRQQGLLPQTEQQPPAVPSWLQARRWMISKGMEKLPTSKLRLLHRLKQSPSLVQQLLRELPAVAKDLGLDDGEVELPEVLIDLLSNPEAQASAALGRRLLEAGPVDELIGLAPGRAATIRLSVAAWKDDQRQKLEEGINATREAAAKAKAADQERIKQHGNPLARSSAETQELHKREVLRQAGIPVGPRF